VTSKMDVATISTELAECYAQYAEGLDCKKWDRVRACFADDVYIDYGDISAPTGAPEVPRRADDWMKNLQGVINGFDITRHTITNHRVTIDASSVSCRAYLIADHVIFTDPDMRLVGPDDVATVVGEYNNHYKKIDDSWKIIKSELVVHWSSGNMALMELATVRAAKLDA
jgi:hypothetical protein